MWQQKDAPKRGDSKLKRSLRILKLPYVAVTQREIVFPRKRLIAQEQEKEIERLMKKQKQFVQIRACVFAMTMSLKLVVGPVACLM